MWCIHTHTHTHIHTYIHIYIYIYIVKYYSAIKKIEILPSAATWMNLESIVLSKISQRKTNTVMIPIHVYRALEHVHNRSKC